MACLSQEKVWEVLRGVKDPELLISVVDLGLVYGVETVQSLVTITLTFTSIGCPAIDMIMDDIRKSLTHEEGVGSVEFDIVWSPPWTKERLTERGRAELRAFGVSV